MASLKFVASQARSIHQYKNLKIKVVKCAVCCVLTVHNILYKSSKNSSWLFPAKQRSIQSQTANYLHSCRIVFRNKILKHIHTHIKMLKIPQNLRHVSVHVGPSSGSMSSLAKVALYTINMYTYVSDVGACIRC